MGQPYRPDRARPSNCALTKSPDRAIFTLETASQSRISPDRAILVVGTVGTTGTTGRAGHVLQSYSWARNPRTVARARRPERSRWSMRYSRAVRRSTWDARRCSGVSSAGAVSNATWI